ncbi:MAG: Zn-dependent metalloprotease [Polaribacter sp.]|jgi:Zn-dependent metalloprotease
MKKIYLSILLILTFSIAFAQEKNKIEEGVPHQRTLSYKSQVTDKQALKTFSETYKLDQNNSFEAFRTSTDRIGTVHERHQQYYKGLKVQFGVAITHTSNGVVQSTNGELYNVNNLNIVPTLSKLDGFNAAMALTIATSFLWEDENQARLMEYSKPEGELLIFPNVKTGTVHLAYKYDIYATAPISRNEMFMDANTGELLYVNPIIKHANRLVSNKDIKNSAKALETTVTSMAIAGTADTRYSGKRDIEGTLKDDSYVLRDETRGKGIVTFNCETIQAYQDVDFTDNDNIWSAAEHDNAAKDNGALDAHWGAEVTYDFWDVNFGRNSFDNEGAQIISYVHYDSNYDNAFWNGRAMTYGDGDDFDILTALDVCGHEIGHAVCSYTADLAYQNQSGGINEGYSDIWGACVEHFGRTGSLDGELDPGVWLIGEDIGSGGSPLRSMIDPNSEGDPDTYRGSNWKMTADEGVCVPDGTVNDYCGVHSNSGVLNHWFYILTVGAEGRNNATNPLERDDYSVTGIGMRKAAEIAFLVERDFLTANSTFADARVASIAVASSLYCANDPETIAVTNAWFAVNVGDEYSVQPFDVSLVSVSSVTVLGCDTDPATFVPELTILNGGDDILGDVEITYSIDGGADVISTETVNLAVCSSTTIPVAIPELLKGAHTIDFSVTTENDGLDNNNDRSILVVFNDSGEVNTVNTFTSDDTALVAYNIAGEGNLWERGAPLGVFLGPAATTSSVYATNLDGNHPDKTIALLVSQCYDLSEVTNTVVKFDMAFDLEEDWDYITFEYSINSGDTWKILGTSEDENWFNNSRFADDQVAENCYNCQGAQWTGEGEDLNTDGNPNFQMREYSHSLSAFDKDGSAESNILFRFFFQSDDATNEEGVIIDNFVVEESNVLSTTENEFKGLSVYPNPTSGIVHISGVEIEGASISIVETSGRVIKKNAATATGNTVQVNIENLASGFYFIVIENGSKKSVRQIIKN